MAQAAAPAPEPARESDFSGRKLKIAFACLVGLMISGGGFAQGAIALTMQPLQQSFGWSRGEIGFALTLMTWAGALAMPFVGRRMDRRGTRGLLLITSGLIALVTLSLAAATNSILQFWASFAVLGLLNASQVGYTKIVSGLFTRHRGKAFALFTAESTIVAAVLPQLMKVFVQGWGWAGLFVWLAAIKLVLAMPILIVWLKDPEPLAGAAPDPALLDGESLGQALKSRVFWLMTLANAGGGLVIYGLLPHLVGMMRGAGLTLSAAVNAMSLMALANIVGQLSSGFVVDKVQTPKVAAAYLSLFFVGVLLISRASAATGPLPLYVGVILMGLGGGSQMPMRNYFFTRYFGLKGFAAILGSFMSISALLTAPAPWVIGMIYDRTHSYGGAFAMLMVAAAISIAAFLVLPRYRYDAAMRPVKAG
ncbi:MAG TPA: MFS transporter [Caulobacteraceae bacterium]